MYLNDSSVMVLPPVDNLLDQAKSSFRYLEASLKQSEQNIRMLGLENKKLRAELEAAYANVSLRYRISKAISAWWRRVTVG